MNYKKTLNLPQTKFPMKANLVISEPKQLSRWKNIKLYERIIAKSDNKKPFVLHDGPPYANGNIHIGTAMNKILKDIVIRSHQMLGFKAEYVPGWDCHGLPIEHNIDKKLGIKKKIMNKTQIRKLCREYANKFVNIHRKEFKRLGVLGEWQNPYLTMNYEYEAVIARECCNFAKNGNLFRIRKPIHWCCNCQTALAEAEIEYSDKSSSSVYIKFFLKHPEIISPKLKDRTVSMLIWTTTPWTLPANLAVALHPNITYVAVDLLDSKEVLIIAKNLVKKCMTKFKILKYKVIVEFNAKILEKKTCYHPIYDRNSIIILGNHVTTDTGTGCVHTAPGHGKEDYDIGNKYKLDPYCPVDEKGIFKNEVEMFNGLSIFKSDQLIIKKLEKNKTLLAKETIKHSYPHCWRCNNPVIFRATPQWFISMEKNELRERALDAIKKVNWIPTWGYGRIRKMLKMRPDWCVSRQRTWGVPIAVFYCKNCETPYINEEIINHIFSIFNKYGTDIWFEMDIKDLMPTESTCKKCGGTQFIKEDDILDVWFDSGVSHTAVLKNRNNLEFPADLYLEGSDQHRGWFQSSLLTSIASNNSAPYKSVLTHGFVVDADGKKMSKSVGNVISPKTIIKKYGVEILRLWVAASDYRDDMRISDNILKQLSDAYRRIRNTCRFLLGNLNDFNPIKHSVVYDSMLDIDKYALHKLQYIVKQAISSYEKYEFHIFYHKLHDYCSSDLSAFYLDILKDRLYTSFPNSLERRSAQTAMYKILDTIIKIMAPILVFTSDEIWQYMPMTDEENDSLHLLDFPKVNGKLINNDLCKKWEFILDIRSEVIHALERARVNKIIGHSLDASVNITFLKEDVFSKTLLEYEHDLRSIFIVSEVNIVKGIKKEKFVNTKLNGISIEVKSSDHIKCERCWIHDSSVGKSNMHPSLCHRCENVLEEL